MTSHYPPTPDWAVSCMDRITKFDDQDQINAALDLITGLSGLNDKDRLLPEHVKLRDDAAQAAIDHGYRKTDHCQRGEEEYLGIAV